MYLGFSFSGYSSSSWGEYSSIREGCTSVCLQDHQVAGQIAVVHQESETGPCCSVVRGLHNSHLTTRYHVPKVSQSLQITLQPKTKFKQTDIQTIIVSIIKLIILIMASFFCHILTSSWKDLHSLFLQNRTYMLTYGEQKC